MEIQEIIEKIEKNQYSKNIIIFVHTLAAGGSQAAVASMVKRFLKKDCGVLIVSPVDGVYREIYTQKCGANVWVYDDKGDDYEFRNLVQNYFDYAIVNSLVSYKKLYYFVNTNIPTLFWIHEVDKLIERNSLYFDRINAYSPNIIYACAWVKQIDAVNRLYPDKSIVYLPIETEDTLVEGETSLGMEGETPGSDCETSEKINFLIPGSYEGYKGFLDALNAIVKIPAEFLEKAHFTFCGYILNEEYYQGIKNIADSLPFVDVLPEVSREEMRELYRQSDCVIIPSHFDAGPLTAVEALVNRKLLIISDATGLSAYIRDCVDAFVFPAENADELFKRILFAISERNNLSGIIENGRQVYLDNFSEKAIDEFFEETWNCLNSFQ